MVLAFELGRGLGLRVRVSDDVSIEVAYEGIFLVSSRVTYVVQWGVVQHRVHYRRYALRRHDHDGSVMVAGLDHDGSVMTAGVGARWQELGPC